MERSEAEAGLLEEDARSRLRAARFFGREARSSDRVRLRRALKVENVPWIRRALEQGLERVGSSPISAPNQKPTDDPPKQMLGEMRAQAIEEIAGTILHELSTPVGGLRVVTRREMAAGIPYEGSITEARIETLAKLLAGIRSLKSAAAVPTFSEVNLADIVRDVCAGFDNYPGPFRFAGPAPFIVELDPDLFRLALVNVVRNALEAVEALPDSVDQVVTLNWNRAGEEVWLSVLDTGLGFEVSPSSMMAIGQSSKSGHIGFGLATAKQAMQRLEGNVYAENSADGGACITLRWFGEHEDTIR